MSVAPHIQKALQHAFQALGADRLDLAQQAADDILRQLPREPHALYLMGVIHHKKANLPLAKRFFTKAFKADPNNPASLAGLGLVALAAADFRAAETNFRKAIRLTPAADASLLNNLGLAQRGQGKLPEALRSFRDTLSMAPGFLPAHLNAGKVLVELGRFEEATKHIELLLHHKPDHHEALRELAELKFATSEPEVALELIEQALEMHPSIEAKLSAVSILTSLGKLERSEFLLREIVEEKPDFAPAWADLAELTRSRGDSAQAKDCYLHAVKATEKPRAISNLAKRNPGLVLKLGHAHEFLGNYDRAFDCFMQANETWKQVAVQSGQQYSAQAMDAHADDLIRIFRTLSAKSELSTNTSRRPVFIVGMPRSGTSLLEQVLSSHPAVHGAGELSLIAEIAASIGQDGVDWLERLARLESTELNQAAKLYLEGLDALNGTATHVVDKMPANFQMLGLIRLMFPNALIIHCRRNPIDTCLSIFVQRFGLKLRYDHDLHDIAHYYSCYHRLMNFWCEWDPSILTMDYETMVGDQEAQTRLMLERLGLPWDDRCLTFHKTDRKVSTASRLQVRQPIYKSSVEKWRRYERQLKPLVDDLGELQKPYV